MTTQPCMVAYGGGLNSTALLVGIVKGMPAPRPDATLFADTGGERPETYDAVATFSDWLVTQGLPAIVTVRNERAGTLEQRCLDKAMLPSVAYGGHKRGCSDKHKQRPQHNWARATPLFRDWWDQGNVVTKLIGYGSDEKHRARIEEDRWYVYEYPLMRWGWDRAECARQVESVGLKPPPKSACFFCPFTKRHEVLALAKEHPDLFQRALVMEATAAPNLDRVKGLGVRYAWKDVHNPSLFDSMKSDGGDADNPFGCLCVGPTPDGEEEDDDL